MKRLNQLSMAEFIDVSCGDYSSLECTDEKSAEKLAVKLIYEYKTIVNPSGVKAALMEKEDSVKLKSKILLYKLCISLCRLGEPEKARDAYSIYNERCSRDDDEMLRELEYKARESDFVLKRINNTKEEVKIPTEEEIRSSFDSEMAFIMTYYKMVINAGSLNAAVYANIVRQANREIMCRMRKRGV